jgi:hypothetical protein
MGHPNLRCRYRRQGHCSLNLPQASWLLPRHAGAGGMTKGRVALTLAAVIGNGRSRRLIAVFIHLGGPKPMIPPVENHFQLGCAWESDTKMIKMIKIIN